MVIGVRGTGHTFSQRVPLDQGVGRMSDKHFDLSRAEELLSVLEPFLSAAVDCKRALDECSRDQAKMIERVVRMGGSKANLDEAIHTKKHKEQQIERLREHIQAVQEYGVLIKDLDMGLIDFPTVI